MNTKEIVTFVKENIPSWVIKAFFFGSNKKQENQMGHKPGEVIHINKYWHLEKRQMEFVMRAFVIDVLLCVINHLLARKSEGIFQPDTSLKAVVLLIEYIVFAELLRSLFRKNLIGYDKYNYGKSQKLCRPIMVTHLICSLLNVLDLIHKDLGFTVILGAIVFAFLNLYCDKKTSTLKKKDIYIIRSKEEYDIGDYVNLETDIGITFQNGQTKVINLVVGDIYFTEDNDILLIQKAQKTEIHKKESIKDITIKDVKIFYDGNRWRKA